MSDKSEDGHPATGINEAPDDHRRTRLLARLADHFPQQAGPERLMQYIKDLRPFHFAMRDVRKGIDRVIATREQASFPPFAVLLRCCEEERSLRLTVQRREVDESAQPLQRRDCSAAGVAQQVADFEMFRKEVGLKKDMRYAGRNFDVKPMPEETDIEIRKLAAEREKKRELEEIGLIVDEVPF